MKKSVKRGEETEESEEKFWRVQEISMKKSANKHEEVKNSII